MSDSGDTMRSQCDYCGVPHHETVHEDLKQCRSRLLDQLVAARAERDAAVAACVRAAEMLDGEAEALQERYLSAGAAFALGVRDVLQEAVRAMKGSKPMTDERCSEIAAVILERHSLPFEMAQELHAEIHILRAERDRAAAEMRERDKAVAKMREKSAVMCDCFESFTCAEAIRAFK